MQAYDGNPQVGSNSANGYGHSGGAAGARGNYVSESGDGREELGRRPPPRPTSDTEDLEVHSQGAAPWYAEAMHFFLKVIISFWMTMAPDMRALCASMQCVEFREESSARPASVGLLVRYWRAAISAQVDYCSTHTSKVWT